jgi:hypothetical protein
MIWVLYKKAARALVLSITAAFLGQQADRKRQERLLNQIGRILHHLKQAHSVHPTWLTQQYSDLDGYLEHHLSTEDWQYLLQLRQAELIAGLPIPA